MADTLKEGRITPRTSDVIPFLTIFLAINFLVAAIYFGIISP